MLDRYSFSFIIALALLVLAQWTQGSFIYVDRSYNLTSCANNNLCPDIKSALSYAVDDDVVLLYPGIYSGENNTNICISYNCPFKNVSMIGQGSPHEIVITRGDSSEFHTRGLNISDGSFSLIKNITFYDLHRDPFTILLDNQPVGGGAMFISASTVILDSVIFRNNSALIGGALTFARSDVVISNAIFQDNAAMSFGGAVFASTSNCSIFQSSFIANNVTSTVGQDLTGSGGAMHFSGTEVQSLVILHSTFVNNTAQRSGGALQLEPSGLLTSKGNVSIVGCTFVRNGLVGLSSCLTTSACNSMGGAVYVSANYMLIDQCVFSDNYALVASSIDIGQGGAVFSTTVYLFKSKSALLFRRSNFSTNIAAGNGGALYIANQNFQVNDCQFVANSVFTVDPLFSTLASQGGALWFSNAELTGSIFNCSFERNLARSGWGGAMYGTSSSTVTLEGSTFLENTALSSYTNQAFGGAVMISNQVYLTIIDSVFEGNHARPNFSTVPLTYSGSGGAIFAQSVSLSIEGSKFKSNAAYTGQFDSGSTGGAIVIEDCQPMSIANCSFTLNSAPGYVGSSSYASSGNGGALYIKFSVANIDGCLFRGNWVSAGGVSNSLGGAIAAFFDYSSVATSSDGVQVNNTAFHNNTAYGQLCSTLQGGSGGALGIVGLSVPPFIMRNVSFVGNIATKSPTNKATSLGGAVAVSLSSNVSIHSAEFVDNLALYGVGNDIVGITASSGDYNYLYAYDTRFEGITSLREKINSISNSTSELCQELNEFIKASDSDSSTTSRRLNLMQEELPRRSKFHVMLMGEDFEVDIGSDDLLLALEKLKLETVDKSGDKLRQSLLRYLLSDIALMQSRRLSSDSASAIDTSDSFSDFLPGIAITSGLMVLELSEFSGPYHIFVGNYGTLVGSSTDDFTGLPNSEIQIVGTITGEELSLTIVDATVVVDLYSESDAVSIRQANIFNAKMGGSPSRFWSAASVPYPTVKFLSNIFSGYSLMEVTSSSRSFINIIHRRNESFTSNSTAQSILIFDGCQVSVSGSMYLDSPFRGIDLVDNKSDWWIGFSNCKVELLRNATIVVESTGSLLLYTSTMIAADYENSTAVVNNGEISLLGTSSSPLNRRDILQLDDIGSLSSVLTVVGQFVQNVEGSLHLILNTTAQSIPAVNLLQSSIISGAINVTFNDDPNLVLYDSTPSTFAIISYRNSSSNSIAIDPKIIAPIGLSFTESFTSKKIDRWQTNVYQQQLVISNIACEQINTDYQGVPSSLDSNLYPCYICLQNSSCVLCQDDEGNQHCAARGMCGTSKVAYSSQCCSSSCNHPYGKCEGSNGNTEFSCKCTGWFYEGTNCDELSLYAIIIIFTGTFLLTTILLSILLYKRSLTQKQQVLEELREGILRHTETANNEYIMNMQQALILNDVFVKFDEIKLESKVGEGSYGIVHKATFRGAQVAVKQMRSMFFELTDKEIEEFRREAYVMSRLRHPNIVLVMGISLVDQEPAVLPKSRTLTGVDEDLTSDKKKPKPQKTVCIITEFLEQGSLADILYGPTRLPAEIWTYELILACALQAARGMLYLHSHQPPICHRDLKSSNLVVDDHWVVKVTDFGMSRIVPEKVQELDKGVGDDDRESVGRDSLGDFSRHEAGSILVTSATSSSTRKTQSQPSSHVRSSLTALEMTSNMGTTAWCAPEVLTASNRARYSVKVDVYSFGMVLWELWEKKRPFDEYSSRFDIIDAVRAGKRPSISDNCPPAYKALIQRCWHTEPSRRPMFHYIVRYLKDELGRVKRQKALPLGSNRPSTIWRPPTEALMESRPSASVGGSFSHLQAHSNDAVSPFHQLSAVPEEMPVGSSDLSHQADSSEKVLPYGRTPLVKAFDRSLSYLTESPRLDSPILARQVAQRESVGSNANARGSNNWRDRYVMRFSGWNSSKPDAGLPPSLAGLTAGTSPLRSSVEAAGEAEDVHYGDDRPAPGEDSSPIFSLEPELQTKSSDC